ncbi:MAG TPA: DUF2865 domain-containing protein [Xanthobacteraceae bacterium]
MFGNLKLWLGLPSVRRRLRGALAAALLGGVPLGAEALAQAPVDQGAARNPMCLRLEAQLAAFDRGQGGDPGRVEQIRRYEEAASKQQAELDRMTEQARRSGCGESRGFFIFGGQPPQCEQMNAQVQRMRSNLERMLAGLQQLQGGGGDREEQRRSILMALGQYDCGPQYRIAAPQPQRPRNLLESLFGGGGTPSGPEWTTPGEVPPSGTFRTVCVRTCDGYYFPISYATVPGKFRDDERACQRMCPAAEVALYSHRNPGEDMKSAMSISGRPYSDLPNAFKYRQEFNAACSCRKPGESWTAAVGEDPTVERGDIVVTEETAKTLSQPKPEPKPAAARPEPQQQRTRTQTPPAARPPAPARPTGAVPPPPGGASAGIAPPPPGMLPPPPPPSYPVR